MWPFPRAFAVCLFLICSQSTARADVCEQIKSGIASLKPGEPLVAANTNGKTYKALYDECDRTNVFNGQLLPKQPNRGRAKCSTDPNRVQHVTKYPDRTIVFEAKMSVDADGSPVIGGSGWPNQIETWLTFDRGSEFNFANAEEVPFLVVPRNGAGVSFLRDTGIGKGDLAVVIAQGKCSFGVAGDAGPHFRLGEASLRSHADVGNAQCANPNEHPCRRLRGGSGIGLPAGAVYIIFPGTRPRPLLSQTVNSVAGEAAAAKALRFVEDNKR